jgi:two-component system, cell cycle response regulator
MHQERSADSSPNLGSDIHVSTESQQLEAPPACRVLVVDDDELVRARLKSHLQPRFDVQVAASGEEALHILATMHCQIVLTDWQMPDMDGLTLCRLVRDAANESYIYVVVLSVRDSKQDVLQGLAAGADDYVIKSAPIEEILARVEIGRRITHVEHALRVGNRDNRRLAVTDSLTGAHNLRYLMKHLPRELARSRRYKHTLGILSCDIDGFKQINERFGTAGGDTVLRTLVARSAQCLRRTSDWLVRTGADEFMIVLPETNLECANVVARKLRHAYSATPVRTAAGPINFTVSIIPTAIEATHPMTGSSVVEEFLRAPDRDLLDKKHAESANH